MKVVFVNPWTRKSVFSEEQKKLSENSVLLIEEAEFYPPELYYIVSALKKKCTVKVIDANAQKLEGKKVVEMILEEKPDFVGIPTNSYWSALCPIPFYPHVSEITVELKKKLPETKIIVWGTHGTVFPKETLKETKADYIVRGEPEIVLPEFILSENKKLKGIAFFEKNKIIDNGMADLVNLKELPPADFSWIDFSHYCKIGFEFPVMPSRGCPFHCSYCSNSFFGKYRERPIEPILREVKELIKNGVKKISFSDLLFSARKERTIELCRKLSEIKNMPEWHCQTRVDCIDREMFLAFKKANCRLVMLGLESAAQAVLEKTEKSIEKKQYEQAVKLSHETGLPIHFFVISFLPGETEQTLKETVDFLKKSQPVLFSIAVATPLPGSKIWKQMIEKKQMKKGDYKEVLENVGVCGETNFGKEFISGYYKVIPTKIALSMGPAFLFERIKSIFKSPSQAVHFSKKIYKMIIAGSGKRK